MLRQLTFLILLLGALSHSRAQLVEVDSITVCGQSIVELHANVITGNFQNVILSDDMHSPVIPLGFSFEFYENTFTSLVISSNNYVTFDTSKANSYSNWTISQPAPNPNLVPNNSILSPFQDVNPMSTFPIYYGTVGIAPNRIFAVTFCELPMYSCTNLKFTSQLLLYEGSNKIEMHIFNKPTCTTWNNGYAIQGIIDSAGTSSTIVTGRNFPNVWSAQQEGWRFTKDSTGQYVVTTIPFGPVPPQLITGNDILWYNQSNQLIGISDSITFVAYQDSYVYARTSFCSPQSFITDTVFFVQEIPFSILIVEPSCHGSSDGAITISPLAPDSLWSYAWSTSASGQSISNLSSGWYYFTIADNAGCLSQDSIFLDQPVLPSFGIFISGNQIFCNILASAYQWFLDGVPIPNSNWSTLNVSQSGLYSVEITTASGCIYTSNQVMYSVGLDDNSEQLFLVYPNPSNGLVYIENAGSAYPIQSVFVRDLLGRMARSFLEINDGPVYKIDISDLSKGMYLIIISNGEFQSTQRIVLH
jgi:hypothetical protein